MVLVFGMLVLIFGMLVRVILLRVNISPQEVEVETFGRCVDAPTTCSMKVTLRELKIFPEDVS